MPEPAQIVSFCRFLRNEGFAAGVSETLDSLAAAPLVPADSLKHALRTELCSSKQEWYRFDDLFEEFWRGASRPKRQTARARPLRNEPSTWAFIGNNGNSLPRADDEYKQASGASLYERLRKADFSEVPPADQEALEQMAERLMRRASFRLSRRLRISEAGRQVDLRRTIRQSISRGGDPLELRHKGKKPEPGCLVILLDVSGSMSLYSFFFLRFAHALQKSFKRAATFVFSTSLMEITGTLRSEHLPDAMKMLSHKPLGWTAGTRIGESLREFNRLYSRRMLTRDTLFLILSDGWDTGEPELLAAELAAIKVRVKRLIWLNPLLGMDGYQPATRGMAAALPYIDVFAPAHSLDSLLDLERNLTQQLAR